MTTSFYLKAHTTLIGKIYVKIYEIKFQGSKDSQDLWLTMVYYKYINRFLLLRKKLS